jgi:hypothetical protein
MLRKIVRRERHALRANRESLARRARRARGRVMPVLVETYSARDAAVWLQRRRMFYLAMAELFGCANGNEWGVAHHRFVKR